MCIQCMCFAHKGEGTLGLGWRGMEEVGQSEQGLILVNKELHAEEAKWEAGILK